jgi:hypothetical protein
MVNELRRLHANFVLVPVNKASEIIVLVCKKRHYYACLLNGLGLAYTSGNPAYTQTNFTRGEILQK